MADKNVKYTYITMKTEDTEMFGRHIAKSKARYSQPTCKNCSYYCTQYCSTETVLLIFPFLQTNITSQMWPSGGKGGTGRLSPLRTRIPLQQSQKNDAIMCMTCMFYDKLTYLFGCRFSVAVTCWTRST